MAESDGSAVELREGMTIAAFGACTSFVVVLLLGAVILGMGFGPSDAERTARAEARSLDLSEADVVRIYSSRCASCHGPAGQGLIGPSFARVSGRLTVEEHIEIVRTGRNNMPAFAGILRDAEIDAVVAYERDVLDGG